MIKTSTCNKILRSFELIIGQKAIFIAQKKMLKYKRKYKEIIDITPSGLIFKEKTSIETKNKIKEKLILEVYKEYKKILGRVAYHIMKEILDSEKSKELQQITIN